MKTQEEIKQLAKEKCTTLYNGFFGYIQGYTQCQEDMADRKYTEEAMLFAFVHGGTKFEENKDASMLNKNFKELINSLNKTELI
jgi:hypothetical protein